jgi:hypothetical protein
VTHQLGRGGVKTFVCHFKNMENCVETKIKYFDLYKKATIVMDGLVFNARQLCYYNITCSMLHVNLKLCRFEDTKGVIRNHELKKDRQYNGQTGKGKLSNKNVTKKTKDRTTGTPLNTGDEHVCSGRYIHDTEKCSCCEIFI